MYTEQLTTPHPRKLAEGEQAQPLLEALNVDQIQQYLGNIAMLQGESDFVGQARIEAAEDIGQHVRKALWFPQIRSIPKRNDFEEMGIDPSIPLDEISKNQAADCFGYSLVASECLEGADIRHWLGYANGHATIILPNVQQDGLYLIDPLTPNLNQDMRKSASSTLQGVVTDISEHRRSDIWVSTRKLEIGSRESDTEDYPWLSFSKSEIISVRQDQKEPSKKVIMSIFEPAEGRLALHGYKKFKEQVAMSDYDNAADSLQDMSGLFPEIDLRRPQRGIRRLVGSLSAAGQVERAYSAIDDYFSSFALCKDSRVFQAKGDCLRQIAKHAQDSNAAEQADLVYARAESMPNSYRRVVASKREKTRVLASQLQGV